jgi:hypothetical protein
MMATSVVVLARAWTTTTTTMAFVRAAPAEARSSATVRAASAMRGARARGALECEITLPPGYHFTPGANSRYEVTPGGARGSVRADAEAPTVRATIRVDAPSEVVDGDVVGVDCVVYFCREEDICLVQRVRFEAVVDDEGGADVARAAFAVPGEASDAAAATAAATFSVPSFD